MIITRAPFRVSFFGGSTDYESFYSSYGSLCIGATIDKYTYVSLRHRPDVFGSQSIYLIPNWRIQVITQVYLIL